MPVFPKGTGRAHYVFRKKSNFCKRFWRRFLSKSLFKSASDYKKKWPRIHYLNHFVRPFLLVDSMLRLPIRNFNSRTFRPQRLSVLRAICLAHCFNELACNKTRFHVFIVSIQTSFNIKETFGSPCFAKFLCISQRSIVSTSPQTRLDTLT